MRRRRIDLCLLAAAALASGCAKKEAGPPPIVEHELPSTQILRVAKRWRASVSEKGFRSEPSPVSVFEIGVTSLLDLQEGRPKAREDLEIVESFEMRDGRRFQCTAKASLEVDAHYGSRHGEPALELVRAAQRLPRSCTPAGYPDPVVVLEATSARFVLSDDALRAFAPSREKRLYLPSD